MKIKTKIVSILLIVIGIVLLCYPKLSEMVEQNQQQRLLQDWEISIQNINNGDDSSQTRNEERSSGNRVIADDADLPGVTAKEASIQVENMEGILHINKIDLQLPILHGVTKNNMKTSVASIINTGEAGMVGNYAIAGHRNRTYGRNFNRLDEVELGDKIQIDSGEEIFEYTVTEKLRVKPEEVWVLEANGEDKEMTLVTCDPMINPTHRLIIKGKIIE